MRKLVVLLAAFLPVLSGCLNSRPLRGTRDTVSLVVDRPDAETVYFACSLDRYEPRRAKKIGRSTWEVTVPADVEFRYFYVVDGLVYIPACRLKEDDDFGRKNCVYNPDM